MYESSDLRENRKKKNSLDFVQRGGGEGNLNILAPITPTSEKLSNKKQADSIILYKF